MGVLIEGMEMPKGCFFCICNKHLDPDTDMCILTRDAFDSTFRVVEHRRDNCPLVPVPPHGDLIERNALFNKCEFVCTDDDEDIRAVRYNIIENAPTIIPAEPPKEEN